MLLHDECQGPAQAGLRGGVGGHDAGRRRGQAMGPHRLLDDGPESVPGGGDFADNDVNGSIP